jgi:hypothetical protein
VDPKGSALRVTQRALTSSLAKERKFAYLFAVRTRRTRRILVILLIIALLLSFLTLFVIWGKIASDKNYVQRNKEDIKFGEFFPCIVQNLLFSSLLGTSLEIKTYRTLILPVILYGCQTFSVTQSAEGYIESARKHRREKSIETQGA